MNNILEANLNANWRNKLILSLVFFFPIVIATVRDAGSTIYGVLIFLSLFNYKKGWGLLNRRERRFLSGFVLFFLLASLSLLMTEDLHIGIARFERYARFLFFIPIYCMLRGDPLSTVKAFLGGIFFALFVMLGQTLYQVEVLGDPIAHGAYHKIIMGDMAILFAILFFVGVIFCRKSKLRYIFSTLAIGAGFYASLLTGTRTAWFFVPIIAISLLWLYKRQLNKRGWKIIVFGIVTSSLFIAVLQPEILVNGLNQGWTDLKTFSKDSNNSSWGTRLVMWRNSLLIFKGSPLFGTGVGDFMHDSIILLEQGLSYKNNFAVNSTNAHSIYFMLLAEGGLVGLTLLVFVLFILPYRFVYGLWKKTSDKSIQFYTLLAMISIIAFAWFGVSESWVNRNPMINAYCITLLVFVSSAANRAKMVKELE